jgi:hypothetical protein
MLLKGLKRPAAASSPHARLRFRRSAGSDGPADGRWVGMQTATLTIAAMVLVLLSMSAFATVAVMRDVRQLVENRQAVEPAEPAGDARNAPIVVSDPVEIDLILTHRMRAARLGRQP